MDDKRLVARWQSQRGRYVVNLYHNELGYECIADNALFVLPKFDSDSEAIKWMEEDLGWAVNKRQVDLYQPDANASPMKRVL